MRQLAGERLQLGRLLVVHANEELVVLVVERAAHHPITQLLEHDFLRDLQQLIEGSLNLSNNVQFNEASSEMITR